MVIGKSKTSRTIGTVVKLLIQKTNLLTCALCFHFIRPTCLESAQSFIQSSQICHGNSGFPSLRTNLSPFTKDFRGGEHSNESLIQFFVALPSGGAPDKQKNLNISW